MKTGILLLFLVMMPIAVISIITSTASAQTVQTEPLFDALNGENKAYHQALCDLTRDDIKKVKQHLSGRSIEQNYIRTALINHWRQEYHNNCLNIAKSTQ